MIDKKFIINN